MPYFLLLVEIELEEPSMQGVIHRYITCSMTTAVGRYEG